MNSNDPGALVNKIIKRYGPTIDLRAHPEVIIDILRRFADDVPDGGQPCGGVPPAPTPPAPEPPPPPPSPSRVGDRVTNEDLMKAVLKLSREVSAIRKALPAAPKARGR